MHLYVKRLFLLVYLAFSLAMPSLLAETRTLTPSSHSDAKALYLTALMYEKGRKGIPKNADLAQHYLILASQAGFREAQVKLGLGYLEATQEKRNAVEARYWLEKASQQGDAVAQFTLATLYQEGKGGSVRLKEAVTLFQQSAKQGYIPAYIALGMTYASGKGVVPDLRQALRYYEFAATHGQGLAQYKLGLMYQAGLGTAQNSVKGLAWLILADESGFRKAKKYRETLAGQLSTSDQEKAQSLKTLLMPPPSK